jgi:hypothetical protein
MEVLMGASLFRLADWKLILPGSGLRFHVYEKNSCPTRQSPVRFIK